MLTRSCVLATATLLASGNALAGDWKMRPQLNVSERFSDNLSLAREPDSGFVTTISPGFRAFKQGGRVQADVDYMLENFFYHGGDRSNLTNNKLRANLTAKLVDPWFYLDANAFVQQAASSLLGTFGADQSTGGEFDNIASVSLTPRVRYRNRNVWTSEASLRTSYVNSNNAIGDSTGNELRLGVSSGTAWGKLGWSANYFNEAIRYSSADTKVDSQNIDAGISYRVVPKIKLLGNVGYEEFNSESLSEKQSGSNWSVGALWTPTSRTNFQATAGRKLFGSSYGLNLSHRTRRALFNLSFTEAITSQRSQLDLAGDVRRQLDLLLTAQGVADPLVRADRINQVLAQIADQSIIFSNQLFLQKRLQGSVVWELPRHTFVLSGFSSSRDIDAVGGRRSLLFGNNDFNISRLIKESGASATWSWQFMPKTSAVSTWSNTLTEFTDIDRDDNQLLLSFGLLHELSRYAAGSIEFRHQRRDSSGGGQDFDENSLEAGLQISY